MYSISVSSHFDSAHKLVGYQGACANLHGHSFRYIVEVSGEQVDSLGMLIDFKDVKSLMKEKIENLFDHKVLNEVPPFNVINPTAENLAKFIYDEMVIVVSVTVYESDNCWATYKRVNKIGQNF